MKHLVKNKTTKNIVLLVNGNTTYLYPKGDEHGRDQVVVNKITEQIKNAKNMKFLQISKLAK